MAAFRRLMAAYDPAGKFRNSFIDRVIALPRSPVSHLRITFRPSETIQPP
jgi:hypothetical protein